MKKVFAIALMLCSAPSIAQMPESDWHKFYQDEDGVQFMYDKAVTKRSGDVVTTWMKQDWPKLGSTYMPMIIDCRKLTFEIEMVHEIIDGELTQSKPRTTRGEIVPDSPAATLSRKIC